MKKNNTLSSSIARLSLLAQRMENCEGNIAAIDRDLFLQELRNLYGFALDLSSTSCSAEQEGPTEETFDEPLMGEPTTLVAPTFEETVPEAAKVVVAATETTEEATKETESELPPFAPAEAEETVSEFVTSNDMENIEGAKYDELFFGEKEPDEPMQESAIMQEEAPIDNTPEEIIPNTDEPAIEEAQPKPEPEPTPVQEAKHPEPEQSRTQTSLLSYLKKTAIEEPEQFSAPRTIGESLHPYSYNIEEQLTNRVNSQKISDLRTIININDKFSFINELFHNNMKSYNDFIMQLNTLQQREEALEYVSTISQLNHWEENSLAVKTFFSLFDRKF